MRLIDIRNLNRTSKSLIRARWCASFLCQLRGLTFRRSLVENEGLLLVQKRESRSEAAIHMLFVGFDLAIIWISASYEVVDVQLAKSWRPFYMPKAPARFVLEISPERLHEFQIGDRLRFEEV